MEQPLQITFRNLASSAALAARIQRRAAELDALYPRITRCRVLVEVPHRHHRKGRLYHVRIDLGVPGRELVVRADPRLAEEHQDVYVAVRDAFDAARRRLEEFARRQRGHKKQHAAGGAFAVVRPVLPRGA